VYLFNVHRVFFWSFLSKISVGQVVMANYNTDEPDERGYWYDVKITKKVKPKSQNLKAKVVIS